MTTSIANEAFRAAPTLEEKVLGAAQLFAEGRNSSKFLKQATLLEAFTTSDFPVLLGKAFEKQAIATQKDAVREFEPFTFETKVADFRPKKLRDLFGTEEFEDKLEGEEYRGGTLDETEIEVSVGTTGKLFKLTRELMLTRDFSDLANFPRLLGNAAVNTENRKVFEVIVGPDGFTTGADGLFETVDTKPLTPDNLQAALREVSLREDHRGDLVDTSSMILLVGPGLQFEANRIVGADELEMAVVDGTKTTKTRIQNPFRGLVQVVVSRRFTSLNGDTATRAGSWALLPSKTTATPAVIKTLLLGNETVDLRVARDQGERIGGGAIPVEQGSMLDDTITFRGRHDIGAAKGFAYGAYASKGA